MNLNETGPKGGTFEPNKKSDNTRIVPEKSGVVNEKKRESQSEILLRLTMSETSLFHTEDKTEYMTAQCGNHKETYKIRSTLSKIWLRNIFYKNQRKAIGSQGLNDSVETMCAIAVHERPEKKLSIRIGGDDDVVRVDLGDSRWQYVKITKDGWKIRDGAAEYFRRSAAMKCLPIPKKGGKLSDLRPHINAYDDQNWHLIASFLLSAYRPKGPYPPLLITGEYCSGKTETSLMIRELIDPAKGGLRTPPKSLHDLAVGANLSWLVSFDNFSKIPPTLSDGFCRLATGSGFGTRKLYTDDEETIFEQTRPILCNGIGDIATRPDLLDRSFLIRLPTLEGRKRPNSEIWEDFRNDMPNILGGLFDAISQAMRNEQPVPDVTDLRMQDAALWVEQSALSWTEPGLPLMFIRQSKEDTNAALVENNELASALCRFATEKELWTGTTNELLKNLERDFDSYELSQLKKNRMWPRTPRGLTNQIGRLSPVLRSQGVDISHQDIRGNRGRLLQVKYIKKQQSQQSQQSQSNNNEKLRSDGTLTVQNNSHSTVTQQSLPNPSKSLRSDGSDGSDGIIPVLSASKKQSRVRGAL